MPFRRIRRFRRNARTMARRPKSIQHVTASMNNTPALGTQTVHIFANASTYLTAGTPSTTARATTANREQECEIGSRIGKTTIDVTLRGVTASGSIEYVVWKRERQQTVPIVGLGLPNDPAIVTNGMQQLYREFLPGRCLRFGVKPVAAEQPSKIHLVINWAKFGMATIRTGDFYGISVFNRTDAILSVDFQVRYKEWE